MPFSGNKTYGVASLTITSVEGTHTSSYSGLSHFNLLATDGNQAYQVNIDSQSSSSPNVLVYSMPMSVEAMASITAPLGSFTGFQALASQPGSGALDFVRENAFAPVLSAWQQASPLSADQIGQQLSAVLSEGTPLLVFGTYYDDSSSDEASQHYGRSRYHEDNTLPPRGMDDVHLNQGTPSNQPQCVDNGIYQDGALFVMNADGSATGFFFMFDGQCLNTDDQGNCSSC